MKTQHIAAAILALAASAAQADPFAITYTSTATGSGIPGINDQQFTLTLVMDVDGDTAINESWGGGALTCAIWRMNDAANVVIAHDLTISAPDPATGQVRTDGGGVLTEVFAQVGSVGAVPPAAVRATGLAPGYALANWFAGPAQARVLYATDANNNYHPFSDLAGSVQMTPARWSNPVPFAGNCLDAAGPASAGGNIAAVPTLGHAALALLGALVGGLGLRGQRRKQS